MPARIVLLGATGYTGARVAEAMTRRELSPVLAGRDVTRLDGLARRLGGLDTEQADCTDPGSVRALVGRGDILVSTVGPFRTLGEPAVGAATDAGAIYFDSTCEPSFVRRVFEHHGPVAERSGAALLTAFGSDFLPGVLAGTLALTRAGAEVARIDVGYVVHSTRPRAQALSRGSLSSLVGTLLEPAYSLRDGRLCTEPACARSRAFTVRGQVRPAVSTGALEHFALPRLAAGGAAPGLRDVDVYRSWSGRAGRALGAGARTVFLTARMPSLSVTITRLAGPTITRLAGPTITRLARPTITRLAGLVARRVADEPSAAGLAASTSYFLAEAYGGSGEPLARVVLTAPDSYSVTAELLAWGAGHAAEHGVSGSGALDPVGAFGLDTLTQGAGEAGIAAATVGSA